MSNISNVKRWSVDIGNVLIWNQPEYMKKAVELKEVTTEEAVDSLKEVTGAFFGLKFLIDHVGADNVWIISKASPLQEAVSRLAFESKFPLKHTGFNLDHLCFCLERIDKAPIIKRLGIEGHIDDRGEVIESIQKIIKCPIWLKPENWDYDLWRDRVTHRAVLVQDWQQILNMFYV